MITHQSLHEYLIGKRFSPRTNDFEQKTLPEFGIANPITIKHSLARQV